jgi:hypothetical protein
MDPFKQDEIKAEYRIGGQWVSFEQLDIAGTLWSVRRDGAPSNPSEIISTEEKNAMIKMAR